MFGYKPSLKGDWEAIRQKERKSFFHYLSIIVFRFCNPFSRSFPTIFSIFMKRRVRLVGYFIFPVNSQCTLVLFSLSQAETNPSVPSVPRYSVFMFGSIEVHTLNLF